MFELYLLGAIGPDDSAMVDEHVRNGCPTCREQLREAALTVYLLTQTARPVRLSPRQKARLLRRLRKK